LARTQQAHDASRNSGQLLAYDEASGRFNGIQCSGVVV